MSHSPLFTSPPKSLCILRLSAVGDVCHALAVVQHIQRHWPQTKLTWIVGKTEMGLLSGIEGVELVPYDKKSGWKGVWNLWMFLKNNQFDVLLNTDICNEYPFIEVYESIMFTYIRGISTEKGARVLEDFIQEYRKNRIED